MHEDGDKVKEGERLAEWDPFTLPIITEQSGMVRYQDLIDGTTMEERVDEATGIAQRVVTEYRAHRPRQEGRPASAPDPAGRGGRQEGRGDRGRALHAGAGHLAVGRGRPAGRGGRHPRPCQPRSRQDARHHRRSAAGGRAVRGAHAQGRLDHRQDQRPDRVRPRLQGQAQDRDRPGRGRSGRVPDPQDQGDRRPGRRLRQEGRHADLGLARTRTTSSR